MLHRIAVTVALFCFVAVGAVTSASAAPAALARLSVTNNSSLARTDEVIELPLVAVMARMGSAAGTIRVREAGGALLVTQLIDETGAGKPDHLLIQGNWAPKQTRHLEFYIDPDTFPRPFASLVYGRFAPERKDDFGWENDKIAYRVYGPKLQSLGEVGSGIDVWCKRVPYPVINEWYHREAEAAKIGKEAVHTDVGTGLDCYSCGYGVPRGCGGIGIWNNNDLAVAQNFTSYKVLANGPIRLVFELTYAPWDAAGTQVSEVKRISLDTGSHLNHIRSTFHFQGPDTLTAGAGLGKHAGSTVYPAPDQGIVSIWEPPSDAKTRWGMISTGLIVPPGNRIQYTDTPKNALLLFPVKSDQPVDYYAGAGWTEFDVHSHEQWDRYLRDYAARLKSPLVTVWQ